MTCPSPTPTVQDDAAGLTDAYAHLVRVISQECDRVTLAGGATWLDTRPMVDPREHGPTLLDVNCELLDTACALHLVVRHPVPALSHLVFVMFTRGCHFHDWA